MAAVVTPLLAANSTKTSYHDADCDSSSIVAVSAISEPLSPSRVQWLRRKWIAIRWQLTRSVFARPVPLLTDKLGLQLQFGDLLLTLPFVAGHVIWSAILCKDHDVTNSGTPAALVMMATFGAVRNNSLLLDVTGLPFERALFYHKIFGGVAWVVASLHGLAYLLNQRTEAQSFSTLASVSGTVMFSCLTLLVVFSIHPFRRRVYDLFLKTHWVLFLVIVLASIFHGAGPVVVGFLPWALDYATRHGIPPCGRGDGKILVLDQVIVTTVTRDTLCVQFRRDHLQNGTIFQYKAGQYVFICIPQISKLQWHPFSIASAPHEPMVTVYVKVVGDWTNRVMKQQFARMPLTLLVDGPYGAPSIEMDFYSHFVLIGGGIGITPMLSIANALYYEATVTKTRAKPIHKAFLLWCTRDRETVEALVHQALESQDHQSWLPRTLRVSGDGHWTGNNDQERFQAEVFATTRTKRPDIEKTLRDMGEQAQRDRQNKKNSRVAVLVCGPQPLILEVVRHSSRLSKQLDGVTFDVHQETFEF